MARNPRAQARVPVPREIEALFVCDWKTFPQRNAEGYGVRLLSYGSKPKSTGKSACATGDRGAFCLRLEDLPTDERRGLRSSLAELWLETQEHRQECLCHGRSRRFFLRLEDLPTEERRGLRSSLSASVTRNPRAQARVPVPRSCIAILCRGACRRNRRSACPLR